MVLCPRRQCPARTETCTNHTRCSQLTDAENRRRWRMLCLALETEPKEAVMSWH